MLWSTHETFLISRYNIDLRTYDHIRINATGQGDDYMTGCLLDYYHYFKEHSNIIAIDLSRQQAFDADTKA